MERWKRLWENLQKTEWKKWMTRENLILAVLTGVLLFVVALPGKEKEDGADGGLLFSGEGLPAGEQEAREGGDAAQGQQDADFSDQEQYAREMEQRLTQALCRVEGVGKVQVMITLKSSKELVLERETPMKQSSTEESDSQGGSRLIRQSERGDTVVYRSEGQDSEPYVVKTLQPETEGVLVVAEGAGNASVRRTVAAIVQALFDVEAHRVSVVKMESE